MASASLVLRCLASAAPAPCILRSFPSHADRRGRKESRVRLRGRRRRCDASTVAMCSSSAADSAWFHAPQEAEQQRVGLDEDGDVRRTDAGSHSVGSSGNGNGGAAYWQGGEPSTSQNSRREGEWNSAQSAEGSGDSLWEGLRGGIRSRLKVIRKALAAFHSFLPYGSWWKLGVELEEAEHAAALNRSLWRLWKLVEPDRMLILSAFVFLTISSLAEVSLPHFIAATIFSAGNGMRTQFLQNVYTLATVTVIYGIFSGLRGGFFSAINQRVVKRMRERLFSTLVNQDISFFDSQSVGDLTSRLGSDCQTVSRIIGENLNIMLRNALQGFCALIYLLRLCWPLAASTAIVSAVLWLAMMVYGRFQRDTAKVTQDTIASANEVAEEVFSLARVVRTFGTEKQETARYSMWAQRLIDIGVRKSVAYGFWTWGSNTLYNGTQVVALFIGGLFVMKGAVSPEQLTKYILYAEGVVHCTWWVGEHWAYLMEAMGASERVFDLLDLPPAIQLTTEGRSLAECRGGVEFRNVTFYYPTRLTLPVLQNVNLTIQAGELVALVGLSGSGKSTLVGLLQRLYETTHGQVLIDGVPLDDIDIGWFRRQLGVVSQEPRLFSTDIASNIAYGSSSVVSQADIEMAAKQANAHDFIMGLPDGYATVVDNARLSGGQKQRIAIARALVRDPKILILDEATSALDAESEHNVQIALDRAMRDESGRRRRTVLVIAHRLSTVQAADRIVVMKGGQVSEVGTHDELLALNGEYARLNRRQLTLLS